MVAEPPDGRQVIGRDDVKLIGERRGGIDEVLIDITDITVSVIGARKREDEHTEHREVPVCGKQRTVTAAQQIQAVKIRTAVRLVPRLKFALIPEHSAESHPAQAMDL